MEFGCVDARMLHRRFQLDLAPTLTQLGETAPSGPQWLHEIKLDGFRMAARIDRGRAQLLTRTGLDWSDKYPSVIAALAKVRVKTAYLDGELCGVGDDGLPSFSQTQAASDGERARAPRLLRLRSSASRRSGHCQLAAHRAQGAAGAADRWNTPAFSSTVMRPATANSSASTPANFGFEGVVSKTDRCALCARKSRPLAQIEMPQSPGIRCRRLDRPRGLAALSRRALARLLH